MWNKEAPAAGIEGDLYSLPRLAGWAGKHLPLWMDFLSTGAETFSEPRTSQTIGQPWGRQGHM